MMKKITQKITILTMLFGGLLNISAQSPSLQFQAANNNFVNWDDTSTLVETYPDFTIEMWVKAATIVNPSSHGRLIYSEGATSSNNNMFRIYQSTSKLYVRPNAVSVGQLGSTTTVFATTSVWHHVAVVGTTPGGLGTETTLKLYIDGVLEDTNTYTRNTNDYNRTTLGNLTRSQASTYAFDGEIDEFRAWSRALDVTEISNNMCDPASNTNLIRHVRLNESSGTTVYDEVAGTSVSVQGTVPTWTTNTSCATASVADEVLKSGIAIYPNPVNDILTIMNIDSNIQIKNIAILDITGREVYTSKISNSINVNNFPEGIYLLKIESQAGGVLHEKIIIN